MKTFACGAVVPGCTATFTAETEEGILSRLPATPAKNTAWPRSPRNSSARSGRTSSDVAFPVT